MLALGLALTGARPAPGGASPAQPITLPSPPASRWHPQFSAVTEAGGRVVSASDLTGLAAATEGGAGIGPRILTDALGRRFWRFEGAEFLTVATSLVFANTRETTVFMVGRIHRALPSNRIFTGGSVAAGTAGNGALLLRADKTSGVEAPFVGDGRSGGANKAAMVAGSQLQVLGQLRRTTANGGNHMWLNRTPCLFGTQGSGTSGVAGAEIGRYSFSPGSSGNWGSFDLYELVVYNSALTIPQGQAVAEALADGWSIPEVTSQLVLEGDSITQGTGNVTTGLNPAMILTEPGMGRIPANWRVVNMASSGNQVPDLVTRRDTTNSWTDQLLPGQNVLAFEIGRNDFSAGGLTAEQHYANVVAYLNTTATGILQRGWTVRAMANIAGGSGLIDRVISYRAMIRAAQFRTDLQTGPGQAFDGKSSVIDTDLITVGGDTVFLDAADAGDVVYYAGDSTHPTYQGQLARMLGGDTPSRGVAFGLA